MSSFSRESRLKYTIPNSNSKCIEQQYFPNISSLPFLKSNNFQTRKSMICLQQPPKVVNSTPCFVGRKKNGTISGIKSVKAFSKKMFHQKEDLFTLKNITNFFRPSTFLNSAK